MNLPHSTVTQTSCNFSPLLMFEFGSIRRCLASLEKSIGEFSMVYKKWVPWCGLWPIITISSTLQGLLKSIPDTLVFQARLVTCKSAKKWYLCACASADCVPLSIAKICLVNYFVNCWWLSYRQKTCKKRTDLKTIKDCVKRMPWRSFTQIKIISIYNSWLYSCPRSV